MRHLSKTKLLLSSCALMLSTTGAFAMDLAEMPMGRASHNKTSLSSTNMQAIESFRKFYSQNANGRDDDPCLVEHQEVFVPYAVFLLETMGKEKQTPHLEELQAQIKEFISKKRVSPDWLIDMHFRFLALEGMGESERDVFNHVPYNKYLMALLAKDLLGNPVVVNMYKWGSSLSREDEYFYEWGEDVPYIPGVQKNVRDLIQKEMAKHLPTPIIYPSLNEGILPITLILSNWLKEIYHVAMPTQNVKDVHGEENSSRVGFAFHDLFHFKNDKRRMSLTHYIAHIVGQYVTEGKGRASKIIPDVVNLAVQKYNLILEALGKAYQRVENDNHALIGFFIPAHEAGVFSKDFFSLPNPAALIDAWVKGSFDYYSEDEAWENPKDPLETSPVDGRSALSDEQIAQLAIERLAQDPKLVLPYQIYEIRGENDEYLGYATEPLEKIEINKKWILENLLAQNIDAVVKRSNQFIDVIFTFPDEETKTVTYPTLNRKWKNVNASLGLLSFAGLKLEKPVLKGLDREQDSKEAIQFLTLVASKLNETVADFAKRAKEAFGEGSGSYAQDYAERWSKIDAELNALIGVEASYQDMVG